METTFYFILLANVKACDLSEWNMKNEKEKEEELKSVFFFNGTLKKKKKKLPAVRV